MPVREMIFKTQSGAQHEITFYTERYHVRIMQNVTLTFKRRALTFEVATMSGGGDYYTMRIGVEEFTEACFYITKCESERLRKEFGIELDDYRDEVKQ